MEEKKLKLRIWKVQKDSLIIHKQLIMFRRVLIVFGDMIADMESNKN